MNKSLLFLSLIGLSLCSCSTIQHTASTVPVSTDIYNLTVADLNVSEKKDTFTIEWKWNPFSSVSLSAQKETAQHELLGKSGADVIVDPQITVNRRGFMRGGSVTVSGYPAKYSNFRPMTREDADKIGIINGNMSTVVVNPVVATSNGNAFAPAKRVKEKPTGFRRSHFIDLSYGLQCESTTSHSPDYQVALTYGTHGQSWGWYAKATLAGYDDNFYGFATGGVIKTLSSHWNFMLGLGLGTNTFYYDDYDYYGYSHESRSEEFTVPIEAGFQWHTKHFNVMLGINYCSTFKGNYYDNFAPTIGIGYTF